ncbi:esterase-like activity of phytase family protein [Micromonospora soli]|uniref:esterase-like activity of phytase family protein n=1 Tax=Micromonospora sp. NBRC 110009 TaxID=3061627 RepID=UPI002672EDE3|nr:esterase-like activity of phytase family protein [Micromonospora sp. NBRC 110009]WKT99231.1 esterase-like activity of phytase family protein [Micromonospora sp. NBRC 110009]
MMIRRPSTLIAVALATTAAVPSGGAYGDDNGRSQPTLLGRAVLPVETYAPGPPSGTLLPPGTVNGVTFPLPSQPVEGFSAIVAGRQPGEYLAMPDNGFGAKANSKDFLIRAYYIRPDFKTAKDGSGEVDVDLDEFIQFRDPDRLIGFTIVNEGATDRPLTGGDIDPESLQSGADGDLWVGDEFGPWLLHFDATGKLLDPPFAAPGGLQSPNNPHLGGAAATQPNSRGFEAMAISPDGRYLYPTLEGATVAELGTTRRYVFEFSVREEAFTGRVWLYQTEQPGYFVSDLAALDGHHLAVVERDGGLGLNALFRKVYVVDLADVDAGGSLVKTEAIDLAAVPDPDLVSLPPVHSGDVGLGNPYRVTCESIEAIHQIAGNQLLLGCDNNFPNTGRNPGRADDSEFIVVKVPGLRGE